MKKNALLLASLLMVFLISCSKDDPSTNSTFSIQQKQLLRKSSSSKIGSNVLIGTFTFSKVLVGVSKIEFKMESEMDDNESEEEIEYEGAYQFDVLNATSTPAIQPVDMKPGVYSELEFEIAPVLSSNNSIEVSGTFNDGTTDYSFEFTSTMNEEYEIENLNGINLNVNETANFILFMQLESLFSGVHFDIVTIDDDNVIRINANSNAEIASLIENNLKDIMDFDDEHSADDKHDNS